MKTTRPILACLALLLLPVAVGGFAGCASTSTRESTGEYIDDSAITTKVKSSLFADPDVSGFAVKVETYKGIVQLSGFVNTPGEKQRAGDIAARVAGVRSVENNLVVKTAATPPPQ